MSEQKGVAIKSKKYKKRPGTSGAAGHFMEINLLTLFKLRGDKLPNDFYLAGNLDKAGDFDDVVFRYIDGSGRGNVIFLQAKSKANTNHKITMRQFEIGGDWDLNKYFTTFKNIKKAFHESQNDDPIFWGKDKNAICSFVLYTNATWHENTWEQLDEVQNHPVIMNIIPEENRGHASKLKVDVAKEILKATQNADEIELLITLLKPISSKGCKNLQRDENFKIYHAFFAHTVLVKHDSCWKFRNEFLEGIFTNESLKQFRKKTLSWFAETQMHVKKDEVEEISMDEIKTRARNWKLQLPDWFGNAISSFNKEQCDRFIENASGSISGNICTITKMSKDLMNPVTKFVGDVFVFDEDNAMFKLNDEKLDGEAGKVLDYLNSGFNTPKLYFDFQVEKFPRLSLGFTKIDSETISEFVSKFTIVTDQPNDSSLKKIIKTNLGTLSEGEVAIRYLQINDKITDWWKQSGDTNYLRKGDGFFDGILSGILFNLMAPLRSFTGRTEELEKLHTNLQTNEGSNHTVVISQMASISGLGGIGKTELARQYANKHGDSYDGNVIWIDAETRDTMANCFRRLCRDSLKIATKNANNVEMEILSIVQEVYSFFKDRKSLFIFDNAKCFRNDHDGIRDFLPKMQKGVTSPYFLITSRNHKWPSGAKIELDVFTDSEAEQLVKGSLGIKDNQQDNDIKALMAHLHNFPLALQQAVAYIMKQADDHRRSGMPEFKIGDYLKLYTDKTTECLDFNFPEDNLDDYTKTTFVTWNITLAEIEKSELGQVAREMFNIMAYLNPNNIPVTFFTKLVNVSDEQLNQVVNLLADYSMITLHEGMANIHRLVQSVTRLVLKDSQRQHSVIEESLSLVRKHKEDTHIVQGASVWNYATEYCDLVDEFCTIPSKILSALTRTLRYEEVSAFGEVAIESLKLHLGTEHRSTLSAQSRLAEIWNRLGKYNSALAQYQEVYHIQNTILGPENPDTLMTQDSVVRVLLLQGNYDEALRLYKVLFEKQTKIHGPDHMYTLHTLGNIAFTLSQQGRSEEALSTYQELLEKQNKKLGPNHENTIHTQKGIANILFDQGKFNAASSIYKELQENYNKMLGPEHPDTLSAKSISEGFSSMGKFEPFLSAVLAACKGSETTGHDPQSSGIQPDILQMLSDPGIFQAAILKMWYEGKKTVGHDELDFLNMKHHYDIAVQNQKKSSDSSIKFFKDMVDKSEKLFGPDHSHVLFMKCQLADNLFNLGKYEEALSTYQDVFDKRNKILGPEDPRTLQAENGIVKTLSMQGKYEEAFSCYREIFEKQSRTLGPEHSETLITEINIADTLSKLGKYEEALCSFEGVSQKAIRLGPFHRISLDIQYNIAHTLSKLGKYEEALSCYNEVYEKRNKTLVPYHPDTLATMDKIAETLSQIMLMKVTIS